MVYVLNGELTLTVNEEAVTIESGEAVRVFGDRKHTFANESHEPLIFIRFAILHRYGHRPQLDAPAASTR